MFKVLSVCIKTLEIRCDDLEKRLATKGAFGLSPILFLTIMRSLEDDCSDGFSGCSFASKDDVAFLYAIESGQDFTKTPSLMHLNFYSRCVHLLTRNASEHNFLYDVFYFCHKGLAYYHSLESPTLIELDSELKASLCRMIAQTSELDKLYTENNPPTSISYSNSEEPLVLLRDFLFTTFGLTTETPISVSLFSLLQTFHPNYINPNPVILTPEF